MHLPCFENTCTGGCGVTLDIVGKPFCFVEDPDVDDDDFGVTLVVG
jgi:hypothetical protein